MLFWYEERVLGKKTLSWQKHPEYGIKMSLKFPLHEHVSWNQQQEILADTGANNI